jgi:hypothetical protein
MLRSALNNHPDIHIAGETHYFDDLRQRVGAGISNPLSGELEAEAIRYFCSLSHRPYGHQGDPNAGRTSPDELRERARGLGGTADAFFRAHCEIEAAQHGKSSWGEKTPRHIFRIDDMLRAFPEARVVCMARDPRAVVASYRNWRNQGGFDFDADPGHRDALDAEHVRIRRSYHPATISLLWRAQMNAAIKAQARWGEDRVFLQRYEDLVTGPDASLRWLSDRLGISFHEAMLSVPMHNSSYEQFERKHGISHKALARWEKQLDPEEVRVVQRICVSFMNKLGYTLADARGVSLREGALWARWPLAVARAAGANRDRSGGLGKYLYRRARLAFGK